MKKIITVIVLITLILSCTKEKITPERPKIPVAYVGNWKANEKTIGGINIYYYFNITADGSGSYKKEGFIEDDVAAGNIFLGHNSIKMSNRTFTIDAAPELCVGSTTTWGMTLSGIEYSR